MHPSHDPSQSFSQSSSILLTILLTISSSQFYMLLTRPPSMLSFTRNLSKAFVFDIDGVLLRGKSAIPQAKPALELLSHHKIPFTLMTNGGGVTESYRAHHVSNLIGVPISPLQIVQSHTPMRVFAQNKVYNRVLVIGGEGDKARHCAHEYGFKDVLMPVDLVRHTPTIAPHHRTSKHDIENYALPPESLDLTRPFDAILVFNDPRDVGTDMQVIMDLLTSQNGVYGTKRQVHSGTPAVPIVFSNNDFYWANEFNLPRLGQGAFRMAVERLYHEIAGAPLVSTILGKPFSVQYRFTHSLMVDPHTLPPLNQEPTSSPFDKIYMVGDNPASDIQGANDNGWDSLLLRTGVYRDGDSLTAKPSVGIFDDVLLGVKYVVENDV